jgi:PAS domain S-box-containing protein
VLSYLLFLALNGRLAHGRHLELIRQRAIAARRAEALQRSEALLERTGALARVGGWDWTPGSRTLHPTPQGCLIFGMAPCASVGVAVVLGMLDDEHRHALRRAVRKALVHAEPFELELPCRTPNGRIAWVDVLAHPEGEPRKVRSVRGAVQDIGDRKLVEQALRESSVQMHTIVDHVLEGIVAVDGDGRMVLFNRAAERIFGYPASEAIGRHFTMLVPRAARPRVGRWFAGAGAHGTFVDTIEEDEGLRRDGSRFPMEVAVSQTVRQGRTSFIGLVRDITDRKSSESALRAAKEAAERSNRAKSEFLANMSHEIRTPMNGVLGMVEMLSHTPLNDEQTRLVATMRRSGRSLLALLKDILDVTKIEAGKLELEQRGFNLRQALQSSVDLIAPAAAHKGLRLTTTIAPGVPTWVVGDGLRLQQVLNNIAGNAVKFTRRGHVHVDVTTAPALGPGGIEICVTDTGPGIAAGQIKTLFDPFVQGDSSTARKHGGAGLGLTIARRLIEAMHGRLQVSSTPGQGSRFCATLQLEVVPAPEPGHDDAYTDFGTLDATPVPVRPRELRILVVEDNAVNQLYADGALRHLGHQAELVNDGQEAIDKVLQGGRYDIILMDCHMPHVDGFEATRRIREHERQTNQPRQRIVALTASAMAAEQRRCIESGMDAVLAKPFQIDELRRLLEPIAHGGVAGDPIV